MSPAAFCDILALIFVLEKLQVMEAKRLIADIAEFALIDTDTETFGLPASDKETMPVTSNLCCIFCFFLVGYVEERLWWPIQSPNIGGKKKASS